MKRLALALSILFKSLAALPGCNGDGLKPERPASPFCSRSASRRSIGLAIEVALPFVPLALTIIPFEELLQRVISKMV